MTLHRITPGELRERLGLGGPYDDAPSLAGLAGLARLAVARWRTAPRREVLRYLREQVGACGWDPAIQRERIHQAVAELVSLKEVEQIELEGQWHLLPGLPRVVRVGDLAFLCGCAEVAPDGLQRPDGVVLPPSILRWVDLDDAGTRAALTDAEEVDLEDWVGEPAVLDHLRRREAEGYTPAALWRYLEGRFEQVAGPVGDPSGYRVICGAPGGFFGKARGQDGRWRGGVGAPDGLWCGARVGYGDEATVPALVEVREGRPTRAMDLFDWDEHQWLVFGRGEATGQPELILVEGQEMRVTTPLPGQLRSVLGVLAEQHRPWRFRTPTSGVATAATRLLDSHLLVGH